MWFPVSFAKVYNFPGPGRFRKYSGVFLRADLKVHVLPPLQGDNERRKTDMHTHAQSS